VLASMTTAAYFCGDAGTASMISGGVVVVQPATNSSASAAANLGMSGKRRSLDKMELNASCC
jgi:hypothetical protein